MAPGFDQICMSRPRIIYLDLALWLSSLFPTSARRVAPGMDTHRGLPSGSSEEAGVRAKTEGNRRARIGRRAVERRTGRDERYVSTGYAGTLTPPDYPMNRNVIYGSFSELEGWRKSRADRAIAYNTSRHVTILKLILLSKHVIRTILPCIISL